MAAKKREKLNRSLKTAVAVVGVLLGVSGMNHGFFETLQGYTRTPGILIQAIGPAQRMWEYGTEEALTLAQNYLFSGLLAMTFGAMIILWSLAYLHTRHSAAVFILLFLLLLLSGGGIGQVVFFLPAWGFATLINKPLNGWKKFIPANIRSAMAKTWPYSTALTAVLFLFALEIAIFGFVPGMTSAVDKLHLCWASLGIAWLLMFYSFVAAIAADIEKQ
ncbi:MAG: hypothetical protein GYA15_07635 [Leptolinea sp.]|jgi:hypothetical protein|nr:hypothetical protein [Leptolinea sp.]